MKQSNVFRTSIALTAKCHKAMIKIVNRSCLHCNICVETHDER
jgi:hemerythrin